MTEKERFTVDSDGNYWDKINHRYVNLDYLFRLVDELDTKLDNKQHTINEMAKTMRIYDDGYIDLNKKYKKVVDENEQLKQQMTKYDEICEKICNWDFDEIVKVLDAQKETEKENERLKETIKELELENAKHIGDGEWDIRDITYGHGKFRLEEWGERYHQFYNGDKQLEDEEVVSLLFENEQLKKELRSFEQVSFTDMCDGSRTVLYMKKENVGDGND